jgi:prepilin-type N-terminal cleavage/methylation domain-containing protein
MKTTLFSTRRGFTLIEIMIVIAIIGLIVGIAMPAFMKSRAQARKQVCIENLSQLDSAKQLWGVERGRTAGDLPTEADLIGDALYLKKMPRCPGGGDYRFQPIGQFPSCTFATDGHSL